jgi:hypothetical protein
MMPVPGYGSLVVIQNPAEPLAADAASLIQNETSKENIECRRKEHFEILRFDILLFCGSQFLPGEVSYKNTAHGMRNSVPLVFAFLLSTVFCLLYSGRN